MWFVLLTLLFVLAWHALWAWIFSRDPAPRRDGLETYEQMRLQAETALVVAEEQVETPLVDASVPPDGAASPSDT